MISLDIHQPGVQLGERMAPTLLAGVLPHISRAHVYRIGDGGAHLHIWFFARPEGQAQLYGSWLVVWDDLLPEYPAEVAEADAAVVADALIASHGGHRSPTSEPLG
jgi:hypothetical protein